MIWVTKNVNGIIRKNITFLINYTYFSCRNRWQEGDQHASRSKFSYNLILWYKIWYQYNCDEHIVKCAIKSLSVGYLNSISMKYPWKKFSNKLLLLVARYGIDNFNLVTDGIGPSQAEDSQCWNSVAKRRGTGIS